MIGGEDFPTAVPVCTRVRYADNIHNAYVFRAELSQKGTRNPHRYHMLPGAGSSFSLIFIPAATTGGDGGRYASREESSMNFDDSGRLPVCVGW